VRRENRRPHLSKTHWEQARREELATLAEMTGLSADEIDASMSAPDHWAEEATDDEA
jgi:hypothetical protein